MTLDAFKAWVDIVSSLVTTLAILVGGGWFLFRRSLAGKLEATMTLAWVNDGNAAPLAILNIDLKNVGQTRLIKEGCVIATEPVWVPDETYPLRTISAQKLNYALNGLEIFEHLPSLEPGEESSESVVLNMKDAPIVEVGLRFTHLNWRQRPETWEWTAFYSAQASTHANVQAPISTPTGDP